MRLDATQLTAAYVYELFCNHGEPLPDSAFFDGLVHLRERNLATTTVTLSSTLRNRIGQPLIERIEDDHSDIRLVYEPPRTSTPLVLRAVVPSDAIDATQLALLHVTAFVTSEGFPMANVFARKVATWRTILQRHLAPSSDSAPMWLYGVFEGARLVGALVLVETPRHANDASSELFLVEMMLAPFARGRGVGGEMLALAERDAQSLARRTNRTIARLTTLVLLTDTATLEYAATHGFERIATEHDAATLQKVYEVAVVRRDAVSYGNAFV